MQAVTARLRIGWVKFRECGELLNGKRLLLQVKGRLYRSYIKLEMLYVSETWCLGESEMVSLWRGERAMVKAMCGVRCWVQTRRQMPKTNELRWNVHV